MENAEVYMLLLRKTTLAPVFGESIEMGPFFGQIILDNWSYKFTNEERADEINNDELEDPTSLQRQITALNGRNDEDSNRRRNQLQDRLNRVNARNTRSAQNQAARASEEASADGSGGADGADANATDRAKSENLTFSFKKTLCTGTTQMLNMMKGGVPFQSALITVVHRAGIWSKVPGFLSVMLTNVHITSYKLNCEQSETNTELNEDWECTFDHLTFKYFRRSDAPYGNVAQKVHQGVLAAQGGIQFIMRPRARMLTSA